jgi:predicted NBD/HSP70 family sugar kinase
MHVAVVDIGGTAIKTGLFDGSTLTFTQEVPSRAKEGADPLMEQVVSLIRELPGMFERIGISTAGQVDSSNGIIRYANENIPGYTGFPLRDFIEQKFSVSVAIENDVNAAAIGEAKYGAGKDSADRTFLCLTYGTGIGGAIVLDGDIYHGSTFSAGEFGAIITHGGEHDSKDQWSGCYEKYASTTALIDRFRTIYPHLDNGKKIFSELENEIVKKEVDLWIDEIVIGLSSLTHIFNPSMIIIGGGIMKETYLCERIKAKLLYNIMPSFRNVKIRKSSLGNHAGLYGAGWLALRRINNSF